MNTRLGKLFALAVLLSLLASISVTGAEKKPLEAYKIGIAAAITGPGSLYGNEEVETGQLAMKYINEKLGGINGHPVELVIEDTKTEPATALTKVKKLDLSDKVSVIIFAGSSPESIGIADYANRAEVPIFFHVGTMVLLPRLKAANSYCYRTHYITKNHVDNLWAAVVKRGIKTIGFLYEDSAYGQSALEEIRELVKANPGIRIVTEIKYSYDGLDFSPEAMKIKTQNPDCAFIGGSGVPSGALMSKNLREVGYAGLVGGTCGMYTNTPALGSIVDGVVSDLVGPAPGENPREIPSPRPEMLKLIDWGIENKRKTTQTWTSMFLWDDMFMLNKVMREAGPDRKKIRDAMDNFVWEGTLGTTRYSTGDHDGLKVLGTPRAMEVRGGKWVAVK